MYPIHIQYKIHVQPEQFCATGLSTVGSCKYYHWNNITSYHEKTVADTFKWPITSYTAEIMYCVKVYFWILGN